jgi:hypothetical protein
MSLRLRSGTGIRWLSEAEATEKRRAWNEYSRLFFFNSYCLEKLSPVIFDVGAFFQSIVDILVDLGLHVIKG